MSIRNLIILSQLNPPAPHSRVLHRDRLEQRLNQAFDYPLTILNAGTGYGKSTTLLSFIKGKAFPVYWFTTSGADRDPKLFIAKLFTAFNQRGISLGYEALQVLEQPDSTPREALIAFLNKLAISINEKTLFILDDFHRVNDVPEIVDFVDWMIDHLPTDLHVIISTRVQPNFPSLNKWLVKGNLLEISKDELIFSEKEIKQLFEELYQISLADDKVSLLYKKTEGWAIGLQVVWQTLQNYPEINIQRVLDEGQRSRTALFGYLAEEVLAGLDHEIQNFLIQTSILSKFDSTTCDFLLNREDSDQILNQIHNAGLFIEELRPGVWRYHELFREFLNDRLTRLNIEPQDLHLKIASYFRAHEYWEEAIYHLLSAEAFHQVNQILENIGKSMIGDGRYETVNYWIHEIPENIRSKYPHLMFLLGEVNRYLENFDEALEFYHTAGRMYQKINNERGMSLALKGQGQIYLDTIQPINADHILQESLNLLDPIENRLEVADLLVLIAENQLNLGLPDSAEAFLTKARQLRSQLDMETDLIQARILLRTGRLQEGIALLNAREANNPKMPLTRPQRFHRESTLLLSLFYSIIGDVENAEKYARQGIEIGKTLKSNFVQSVGFMRLGLSILLRSQQPFPSESIDVAMTYFQKSIDNIEVTRIHVEPLWGMCRALGYSGQIQDAEKLASESLAIAKKAGDEWISVLIQLSLGAGAVLAEDYDIAQQFLSPAEATAYKVKDPFLVCVAKLWLSIKAWKQGFQNTAFGHLEKLLPIMRENNYAFLISQPTLMGLKDPEIVYPLLLAAYKNGIEQEYLQSVFKLRRIDPQNYHPGYTLWIRTFGRFQVWQGGRLLEENVWKREKARQLLELLVVNRDKWLHKDQINSILWADTPVENASNYLKVVFNTLNQIIEPNRPRGTSSYFVERCQESYRLNPQARIIIDADLFEEAVNKGMISALETSINLYQGKYFDNCFMQEWCVIEEQYYHQQYLMAAEQLICALITDQEWERALEISYQVLNKDPLWEPVYRYQMEIFSGMGKISMVRDVYNQCQKIIADQLDYPLSNLITNLYEKIMAADENGQST
jgi:DNA-binding SARP family transcriptional activator/tetratricopeptide (TPR) repeat protein